MWYIQLAQQYSSLSNPASFSGIMKIKGCLLQEFLTLLSKHTIISRIDLKLKEGKAERSFLTFALVYFVWSLRDLFSSYSLKSNCERVQIMISCEVAFPKLTKQKMEKPALSAEMGSICVFLKSQPQIPKDDRTVKQMFTSSQKQL